MISLVLGAALSLALPIASHSVADLPLAVAPSPSCCASVASFPPIVGEWDYSGGGSMEIEQAFSQGGGPDQTGRRPLLGRYKVTWTGIHTFYEFDIKRTYNRITLKDADGNERQYSEFLIRFEGVLLPCKLYFADDGSEGRFIGCDGAPFTGRLTRPT